jgi:polysaccharide export outer membrane protein
VTRVFVLGRLASIIILLAATAFRPLHAQADSRPASQPVADSTMEIGLIHPGDIIRLRIWREPDLSGEFLVDEQGVVVFPKIGPRNVLSDSSESLKSDLSAEYQVYLRNPSIEVTLLRRVNVLGAVRNPGLYPVDLTMTVSDVIAAAGGATPQGKTDEANLIRAGKVLAMRITRETRMADLPLRSGDQIFVPERSWFTRNSGVVAAALTASISLVIALLR